MSNLTITFPRVPESYTYIAFCELRQQRPLLSGRLYQVHHILPRCLGGSDDRSNLVSLTHQEHFLAHCLLHLMFPKHYGLKQAIRLMAKGNANGTQYQEAKLALSNVEVPEKVRRKLSESTSQLWKDPEYRNRVTESNKGRQRSEETRSRVSEAATVRWETASPEYREKVKQTLSQNAKNMKPETKQKMSDSHRGKKLSPGHVKAASEGRKNREVWKHFDYLFQVWQENNCCGPCKLSTLTGIGTGGNSLKTIVKEFKNMI